jgi:hypothetical protein
MTGAMPVPFRAKAFFRRVNINGIELFAGKMANWRPGNLAFPISDFIRLREPRTVSELGNNKAVRITVYNVFPSHRMDST